MPSHYRNAVQTNAEMRASANETLEAHDIVTPPVNIFQILHDENIPVDFRRFKSKKLEGIYLNNATGPSIAISSVHHYVKKRFTGAHELKHHRHDYEKGFLHCKSTFSRRSIEAKANRFAAELLMPVDMFQAIVRELQIADLLTITTLSRVFGVSYAASVYRLNTLEYITKDHTDKLLKKSERKKDTEAAMGHSDNKNVAQLRSQALIVTLSSQSGLSYCPHCSELVYDHKWKVCYGCGDILM